MTNILRQYPGTLESALLDTTYIIPGNRLLLRGGSYHITSDLAVKLNGVTIMPYPNETAILLSEGGSNVFLLRGVNDNCHDMVFDSLILRNNGAFSDGVKITDGAFNITFQNCEVDAFPGQGFLLTNGLPNNGVVTHGITIKDCHIHHCGDPITFHNHGIYSSVDDVTIDGNEIDHIGAMGIQVYEENVSVVNTMTTIKNNFLHDNYRAGIGVFLGITYVYNNISRDNGVVAMWIKYRVEQSYVYANTFVGTVAVEEIYGSGNTIEIKDNVITNGRHGLSVLDLGSNTLDAQYNLINGIDENYSFAPDDTGVTFLNNLIEAFSPISDDGAGQVIPTVGNPAIGAGVAVAGITTDYGGNARANPPTIGAWEA